MYKLIVIVVIFLLGLYFISRSNKIESFTGTDDSSDDVGVDARGNMTNSKKSKMTDNCPDLLIQKGSALFLYNSKRGNVPGVNPIRFENLEEYVEFTEWQRSQGILCPVLFLQHAYNAQGDPVYKARPSPTNLQGGLQDYYVDHNSLPNGMVNSETIANIMNNPNIIPPPAAVPIQGYGNASAASFSYTPPPQKQTNPDCGSIVVNETSNYPAFNTYADIIGPKTALDNSFNGLSPNPMDDNWGGMDFTERLVESGYYKDNEVKHR